MQLNRLTDYAVVVLGQMTRRDGDVLSALHVSDRTGLPLPTVQKVLKHLSKANLVSSQRGVGGGYMLTRDADQITVGDVVTAMQGPIQLAACVDGVEDPCSTAALCPLAGNWNRVNEAIREAFASVTLAEMVTYQEPTPKAAAAVADRTRAPALTPAE